MSTMDKTDPKVASSVVSVGSNVINDLVVTQVRYADKPDGLPTGPWGGRRESWDSFTSDNAVGVTGNKLKARHLITESYQRKLTPEIETTLQALAPQDKLSSRFLHLRHTPKSAGKPVDDLTYTSCEGTARFTRRLAKRNRVVDNDGVASAKLKLLPGSKDSYHVTSTRHCKDRFHLGHQELFRSIEDPRKFAKAVRRAVPNILQTEVAGFQGQGIDGLRTGLASKSYHSGNRKPNATTHSQDMKFFYDTPTFTLEATETYDLAEDDRPLGIKDTTVKQTWRRGSQSRDDLCGETYEEKLENNGTKIIRSREHAAIVDQTKAGAVLIDSMRATPRVGSKKTKTRKSKGAKPSAKLS